MKSALLSTRKVEAIIKGNKWGRHSDGGGLFLVGSPTYKSWSWQLRLYRGTVSGKPRDMGIGSVELYSLKEARERARRYRQMAADGVDPIEARQVDRDTARAEKAGRITFKEAATRFLAVHTPTWKNAKHRQQWQNTLAQYAF